MKVYLNKAISYCLVMIAIALFVLMGGCANGIEKTKQEETEDKLSKRLDQYAHAMSINDFDATYSFESKETRSNVKFEEYLKEKHASNVENEIYKIARIQYDNVRKEYLVKIKVILINMPGVTKISLTDMRGEWWTMEDGDWYRKGPAKKMKFKAKENVSGEKKKAPDKKKEK